MADVKHAVYNSDNVSATTDGSLIVSMKYMGSGSAATAIDNGNIVLVGELMAGEKQIHKATTPAANSPRAQLAIVTTVEEDKKAVLKSDTNLEKYTNEAGKTLRGFRFHTGDTFSVSAEALDGTPKKGDAVEVQAGTKMKVVKTTTAASTQIGKIVDETKYKRYTLYTIEVQ